MIYHVGSPNSPLLSRKKKKALGRETYLSKSSFGGERENGEWKNGWLSGKGKRQGEFEERKVYRGGPCLAGKSTPMRSSQTMEKEKGH